MALPAVPALAARVMGQGAGHVALLHCCDSLHLGAAYAKAGTGCAVGLWAMGPWKMPVLWGCGVMVLCCGAAVFRGHGIGTVGPWGLGCRVCHLGTLRKGQSRAWRRRKLRQRWGAPLSPAAFAGLSLSPPEARAGGQEGQV